MGIIYLARCKVNGKCYVGQAVNIKCRIRGHKRDAENGSYCVFHCAIRKYGWDAFEWTILYEDDDNDKEWMDWLECKFIKKMGTKVPGGYNMTSGGESTLGAKLSDQARINIGNGHRGLNYKKMSEEGRLNISKAQKGRVHTEETKKKMSESHSGYEHTEEAKKKISEARTGITLSEDTKKKIGESSKNRIHLPCSEETKEKISSALSGRKRSAESIAKQKATWKSRPLSEESRLRMSESHIGNKHSEETKKKMSLSHRKNK